MSKEVVAIVVTYNRINLLKECIQALQRQTYSEYDIVIIDNASTDGTGDFVASINDSRIKYINTGSNLGGAGGFSYGMNMVLKDSLYDYIWLMDDDTIPCEDALESLVSKSKQLGNNFSFLASVVKWIDGSSCIMNLQTPSPLALKNVQALDLKLIEIEYSSFVSCFINLAIAKEAGLPIKEFFIYGDDVEYTQRLMKLKKGYLDLDSQVIHKMVSNENVGIVLCPDDRIDRYFYAVRNSVYMIRSKSAKKKLQFIWRRMKSFYSIFRLSPSKKMKRARIFIKGIIAGIRFSPQIVKEYR